MTENYEIDKINLKLRTKAAEIEVLIDSSKELSEMQEEIFRAADFLHKINSIFELRERFAQIYSILPNELIIHYNDESWGLWEKVLLILLSNHSFETFRSDIWNYGINQSSLRTIIRDKPEYIEAIGTDKLKLTEEGLKYILDKLTEELKTFNDETLGVCDE